MSRFMKIHIYTYIHTYIYTYTYCIDHDSEKIGISLNINLLGNYLKVKVMGRAGGGVRWPKQCIHM
jgi:hypothetical protein